MLACRPNDRDLPSWSCEFDSRHSLRSKIPSRLTLSAALGPLWPHLLEFTFDPELQRIRDLAIPLARRVLVNQCRTHAAVAHAMYQLASAGAACRCQVVASVA